MTLDIQILPLMPGSTRVERCWAKAPRGLGALRTERRNLIISSVRRSHLSHVEVRPKVCHNAVHESSGILGKTMPRIAVLLDMSIAIFERFPR